MSIEEAEIFYGCVVFGKFKSVAQLRDYLKNFVDIDLVFDKTSPVRLYLTETNPKEAKE